MSTEQQPAEPPHLHKNLVESFYGAKSFGASRKETVDVVRKVTRERMGVGKFKILKLLYSETQNSRIYGFFAI